MANHPVFISYARKTSKAKAEALHRELGGAGGLAFLDTSDIEALQKFPAEIANALLAAKVVVVFADETYFTRWYCLREFDFAVTAYQMLTRRSAPESERNDALSHVIVALPQAGVGSGVTNLLPPELRTTNWPNAAETERLAQSINDRVKRQPAILERLSSILSPPEVEAVRMRLKQQAAIPQPRSLKGLRVFPAAIAPSLGEGFKGRADDLWRLHHALWTMGVGTAALTGAIEAGAGYGKSRLALEYLHRYGPEYYKGGLFWIDAPAADDELKQEQAFHGILCTIEPSTPPLKELHERGRMARSDLASALQRMPTEQGVLFLIDNVPEPECGKQPRALDTWCPALGLVTTLATSRMHVAGGSIQELNIDVLAPEDSVALLTYEVMQASALTHTRWLAIAEWVGHLPLALDPLQRAMKAGALSPVELFTMASERRAPTAELDRLTEAISPNLPLGAVRGITEALNVSYERMPEDAKLAARLIAQLAPEPVPLALLKAFGEEAASLEARAALVTRSFVTPVEPVGSADKKVEFLGRMHRVMADFLRAKSADAAGELLRAGRAVDTAMLPDACRNPVQWPLMNASLPHAEHVFARLAAAPSREEAEAAVVCGLRVGILYSAQGVPKRAQEIGQRVWKLASEVLGPEHPNTLTSMNNLAATLWALGDLHGARKLEEQVLDIRKRVLGPEHPDTLTSMNNLAETLRAHDDLQGARRLQEQVLDVQKRLLGPEHPVTLISMNNLAGTLGALGDLQGARTLQEQVLDIRKRVLGPEHPRTLTSLNNLAGTLYDLRDLQGARRIHEQTLEAGKRVLGVEHPDTSTSAWNLVDTLDQLEETESAQAVIDEYLAWLLKREPESLGANQRRIREMLMERGK